MTRREQSLQMFERAGIDRDVLHEALRMMGPKALKPALRADWSPQNPTRNFCYVVTEWLISFILPEGSKQFKLSIPGDVALHWFARMPDGVLVDLTLEQFSETVDVPHDAAKRGTFMPGGPSKRARELHEHYKAVYRAQKGAPYIERTISKLVDAAGPSLF